MPKPTPHACDDGSHGCDKGPGGICYKVDAGVSDGGWLCDCKEDYKCVGGCDAPHEGHTCELTAAPTPAPTAKPTPAPTAAPTPVPTTTTTTTTTTPAPVCHEELDLVIVLDGSTSLHADGFEKARGFVQSMVAYLDISPTAARVAVVQYSGPKKYYPEGHPLYEEYGKVETGLTGDRDALNAAIQGMRYVEEGPLGTYTGAALRMANTLLDSARADAVKAVLVLFDGGAHDFKDVKEQAKLINDRDARLMFAVVAYPGAHIWEVMSAAYGYMSIASQPSNENVFQDGTYEQFTTKVASYAAAACSKKPALVQSRASGPQVTGPDADADAAEVEEWLAED